MDGEPKPKRQMKVKALALFSGGLDSTLSTKITLDQGVEVNGIYFVNAFLSGYRGGQKDSFALQKRVARQLGIRLHILDISQLHLELVQRPRYGYGANMNPCIDCRILMLKQAKVYMESHGFSFLISGELLGQRPMSQRRDALNIIDRDAHVKGLLLRPLSAKKLAPTFAEDMGWVDRDRLFGFSGRSRKPQLALAKRLGVKEYSSPAGGCLLTETEFARKFKDLLAQGSFDLNDVHLLKVGRHFRYGSYVKIIVGRDERENGYLADLAQEEDTLLKMRDFVGPLTIVRRDRPLSSNALIETAARLTVRYSKGKEKNAVWVDYWRKSFGEKKSILVSPAEEDLIARTRI